MRSTLLIILGLISLQILSAQEPVIGPAGGPTCTTATPIGCGVTHLVTSSGAGLFTASVPCTGNQALTGMESYYRFTPPANGAYTLLVTVPGAPTLSSFSYYFQEEVPNLECGNAWQCIGNTATNAAILFGPLVAGKTYLILADCSTTQTSTQNIQISGCRPANDIPSQALDIKEGACASAQSNISATKDVGEPDPDIDTTDGYGGRWLASINRTLWYRFVAPGSGTVTISTEPFYNGQILDTRVALYQVGNPNDYSTYRLLESDDNETSPMGISFNTLNARIPYTGLTPGEVYYIQVDASYSGAPQESPYFCISIKNCLQRTNLSNCSKGFYRPKVNGKVPGGNRWYGIYTQPATGDLGEIAAAILPNEQNLDTVFCQLRVFSTVQTTSSGLRYMPAYYRIYTTKPDTLPVDVRLFYSKAELDSLKKYTNMPMANIGDLNVTLFTGSVADCNPSNNVNGISQLVEKIDTVSMTCANSFFLQLANIQPGEFMAHFGPGTLPVELRVFTGKNNGNVNLLSWQTALERGIERYTIQRSTDGHQWENLGSVAGKGDSNTGHSYSFEDKNPPEHAYYRLAFSEVLSNTETYSAVVHLFRKDKYVGIEAAYPNPVTSELRLQLRTVENEGEIRVEIHDIAGRKVLEQQETGTVGEMVLDLKGLKPGFYLVTLVEEQQISTPIRIIKQ
jgi:hypothetical protein